MTDLLLLAPVGRRWPQHSAKKLDKRHRGQRHMCDWWRPTAPSERDIRNKEHLRGNVFSPVTAAEEKKKKKSSQVKEMKGRRAGDWMLSDGALPHWQGSATANSIYGAALNGKGSAVFYWRGQDNYTNSCFLPWLALCAGDTFTRKERRGAPDPSGLKWPRRAWGGRELAHIL